jgi:hypothetical protein
MNREYEIFEKFADGSVLWKCVIPGLENTIGKLKELALESTNEYFALHSQSNAVVARVNIPKSDAGEAGKT